MSALPDDVPAGRPRNTAADLPCCACVLPDVPPPPPRPGPCDGCGLRPRRPSPCLRRVGIRNRLSGPRWGSLVLRPAGPQPGETRTPSGRLRPAGHPANRLRSCRGEPSTPRTGLSPAGHTHLCTAHVNSTVRRGGRRRRRTGRSLPPAQTSRIAGATPRRVAATRRRWTPRLRAGRPYCSMARENRPGPALHAGYPTARGRTEGVSGRPAGESCNRSFAAPAVKPRGGRCDPRHRHGGGLPAARGAACLPGRRVSQMPQRPAGSEFILDGRRREIKLAACLGNHP